MDFGVSFNNAVMPIKADFELNITIEAAELLKKVIQDIAECMKRLVCIQCDFNFGAWSKDIAPHGSDCGNLSMKDNVSDSLYFAGTDLRPAAKRQHLLEIIGGPG